MVAHAHKPAAAHKKQPRQVPAHVLAFVNGNIVAVKMVSASYRVPPSIILAQAGLESGWGLHVKGNAYFGVKGKAPDGTSVNIATHENTAQGRVAINDNFRAYTSFYEAADDYGRMLSTNSRFAEAFQHTDDAGKFAEALQRGGYATDPGYANKLKTVIKSFHLDQYDAK